jgi:hypothetical protein
VGKQLLFVNSVKKNLRLGIVMIHPDTQLQKVNDKVGYGVFATQLIPKGTIIYVKDLLEIEVTPEQFAAMDIQYKAVVDWFSYVDQRGVRIVSWDIAKYVNHHCDSNSISTGYGFDIATRDIQAAEEITDEYGIFNLPEPLECCCDSANCRGTISNNDWDTYWRFWDKVAQDALSCVGQVPQPLMHFMDSEDYQDLTEYLRNRQCYKSVLTMRFAGNELTETIG